MFLNNTFFAQSGIVENKNQVSPFLQPLSEGLGPLIVIVVLTLGLLAILLAFVPPDVRRRIPFIAIISGFFGFTLLSYFLSASVSWLLQFSPGVIGSILIFLLIDEFINIQFIWGFCAGINISFLLFIITAIFINLLNIIVSLILFMIFNLITGFIIYWTFIYKRMKNNNFDNFQIYLTMNGTMWVGIALGFLIFYIWTRTVTSQ